MTEANFEAVLIGELGELRGQQAQLLAGLGEVKADITHPEGRNYYGTLWRTGSGTKYPLWSGPVRLIKPAATS